MRRFKIALIGLLSTLLVTMLLLIGFKVFFSQSSEDPVIVDPNPNPDAGNSETENPDDSNETNDEIKTGTILVNGDVLLHDLVYWSAYDEATGTYDFKSQFAQVKSFIQSADLAIADFEGSISDVYPLGGYPIFNAPKEITDALKDTGYDVVTLANNHILDSRKEGLYSTYEAFHEVGIDTLGVLMSESDRIVIKDVNGIKVALMAYSYGYNGMEANLTQAEYDALLTPINEAQIYADIQRAKEMSDFIIILPHMGVEYMMGPTQEQVHLYHQMIEWGADVVLGNHPHVVQPSEVVQKDGLDKFILYSLGNFLSNQRIETVDNIWTERGVIIELQIRKEGNNPVVIDVVKDHPTWVSKVMFQPVRYNQGFELYQYQVLLTQEYLEDDHGLDSATLQRIRSAYYEVKELIDIPDYLQKGQP